MPQSFVNLLFLSLFAAGLAVLPQEPLLAPKEVPSPEGVYLVAGTTSEGADYEGVAMVDRAGDGVHFSQAGYNRVADLVYAAMGANGLL